MEGHTKSLVDFLSLGFVSPESSSLLFFCPNCGHGGGMGARPKKSSEAGEGSGEQVL